MTEPPEQPAPPEPADPRRQPRDITRLLYKAVRQLPEEEQAAVFEYFFELGVGAGRPAAPGPAHSWTRGGPLGAGEWPAGRVIRGSSPSQIIPVRLSEDSHRRLKEWCATHDFHMSVVVRGLVERFLDSWQEPGASAPERSGG